MIEVIVREHLAGALSVPVALETPTDPPASYVTIEKTGSGAENKLQRATLAVRCAGPSLYDAAVLCGQVKAAMEELRGASENVFGVYCETDYNFTDTRTKERRYQAVFHVYYLD